MTLGEQLIQEGRKEGRKEGRQEGRLQTLREDVLEILEARFGDVPGEVHERIETLAEEARLKSLHRHAALAGSLEEFRSTL